MPVALLFTDIEGSTSLAERSPAQYREALDRHHQIVRKISHIYGGEEFQETGDGFCFSFPDSCSAAQAAIEMQDQLQIAAWPSKIESLKVRMSIHWTNTEFRENQHRGVGVHLAARLLQAGHGGQILCSESTVSNFKEKFPSRKLGSFRLRGFLNSESIYQLQSDREFPPLRLEAARRHNLPPIQDAFIGREAELTRIHDFFSSRLSAGRLFTITGLGGIGKTRLALAAAHRLLEHFGESIIFVSLNHIDDATSISAVLCEALGGKFGSLNSSLRLRELLAGTPTLAVLDNFEHLATGGAPALDRLLSDVPDLHLLITSRIRVGGPGERELLLSPFPLAPNFETRPEIIAKLDCVKMFLACASRARAEIHLTSSNAGQIAAICRILSGMPLALELAAARLGVLAEAELLAALEQNSLHEVQTALPELSQSLRTVFEWSRSLLPPDVASFLAQLTIFRGGWTAAMANEICDLQNQSRTFAYLHYLITCSLVRPSQVNGQVRFEMLEPIRQMAATAQQPDATTRQRYRDYFHNLVHKAASTRSEGDSELSAILEAETPNILDVLAREPDNQRRIFSAVDFHIFASQRSCHQMLRPFLTELREDGGAVKNETLARGWMAAGNLNLLIRDHLSAAQSYERAAEHFEKANEKSKALLARFNLGVVAGHAGDLLKAREIYTRLLAQIQPPRAGVILANQADIERRLGNLSLADDLAEKAVAMSRDSEDLRTLAFAYYISGKIHLASGRIGNAHIRLTEALALKLKLGHALDCYGFLCSLGEVGLFAKQWPFAAFFFGASKSQIRKHGIAIGPETQNSLEKLAEMCVAAMGKIAFESSCLQGAEADPAQWISHAAQLISPLPNFVSQTQDLAA